MTIQEQKKNGYITLKEASERFGYAPDYIGQLIRKGKIEGKQVYANVAWVTTEEAMEAYKAEAGEKRAGKAEQSSSRGRLADLMLRLSVKIFSPQMTWVHLIVLRVICAFLILVLVIAFYLLSIALDRALSERAAERLKKNTKSEQALLVLPPISYQGNAPFRI